MSRKARKISLIDSYTISFSSAENVQFDKHDIEQFLDTVDTFKEDSSYKVIAYNLNATNFYLAVADMTISIESWLRKVSVSFAKKFNARHSRRGIVFCGRATTVPAKDYNQVDEMICKVHNMSRLVKTTFTSEVGYFKNKHIDHEYVLGRFETEQNFRAFCKKYNNSKENVFQRKLSDEELGAYIKESFSMTATEMHSMPKGVVETIIGQIVSITKASARQISRVTSLPLRFLWGLLKNNEKDKVDDNEKR